jgi:hypothetical protein
VRRLLLFVALLTLLGLSTAFAASFDVSSEDIATFSTDVSISVPIATKTRSLYLNGTGLPAMLATDPPVPRPNPVNNKQLDVGTLDVKDQSDPTKYQSWETAPDPLVGLVLNGPVVLHLFQNGTAGKIRGALFDCAPATATAAGCVAIGTSVLSALPTDNDAVIDFGPVTWTIEPGRTLRLQVMNPLTSPKLNVQWGYKTNRESRLDVTVVVP